MSESIPEEVAPSFDVEDFPTDATDIAVDSDDASGSEFACIVCGRGLHYGGRGRHPKYCDEHKPRRSSGSPRSTSRGKGTAQIRKDLHDTFLGVGALLVSVDQYDAAVVIASAPRLADTLGTMADQYPEFRKFLEEGNKSVVWLQLGIAVSALAIPIMAHHGILPMDERDAFVRFHGDPSRAANPN